jgi:subtilisin family serine protease
MKMNKKVMGLITILLMIISSLNSIVELNSNSYTFEQNSSANPLEKIDSEILKSINSKGGLNNIADSDRIKTIIILNDEISIKDIKIPSYVDILQQYSIINGFLAEVPLNKVVELSKMPTIESIWSDHKIDSYLSENNKQFIQGFLNAASSPGDFINFTEMIGATDVWAKGYNGSGVVIAIMDAGVDITGQIGGDLDDFDEDFNTTDSKFVGAVSLVPEEPLYYTDFMGRGTYHAGLACGTGYLSNSSDPTNRTYIGVAPGASYLNVKIYDSVGITYWSFMISGVEWAIQHSADILLFCTAILGLYLDPISMAITNAVEKGLVVVVPTGDEGPSYMSVTTPGSALGAISVGAYNPYTEDVANFSSRGPGYDFRTIPDIIAPGVDIIGPRARIFTNDTLAYFSTIINSLSENAGMIGELLGLDTSSLDQMLGFSFTFPDNIIPRPSYGSPINENYTKSSGTGAAAAIVAGALALLIQAFPLANPQLLRTAICTTAKPINKDQNAEGSGLINVSAAYDYLNSLLGQTDFKRMPFSAHCLI